MHWVLQENIFNEDGFKSLEQALIRLGIPYSTHKVVPFVGELFPKPDVPNSDVIVMGSYSMANYARKHGWTPGSFDNDNLDFEKQFPHWGKHMFNADSHVCRFEDVPEQSVPFFIRPTLDSKSFTGYTTDWPTFNKWQQRVISLGADNGGTLYADTMVQISTKKQIYSEYRLWMLDDKVITASLYRQGGRPFYSSNVDERIIKFGEYISSLWSPARAYVLDICESKDGLFVLEAGCINAAGFYAANTQKLVEALESANFKE